MRHLWITLLAVGSASSAFADNWTASYEAGLKEAKGGNWAQARADFRKAGNGRGDSSRGVMMPGSIFEQRSYREGAPFSPHFLAAYSAMKWAMLSEGNPKTQLLNQAAGEFQGLLSSGQYSRETFFFLDETYILLSDTDKRVALGKQFFTVGSKATWRVDTEGISQDDEALVQQVQLPAAPVVPKALPAEKPKKQPKERTTKPAHVQMAVLPLPLNSATPAAATLSASTEPTTGAPAMKTRGRHMHSKVKTEDKAVAPSTTPVKAQTPAPTPAVPVAKPSKRKHDNDPVVAPSNTVPAPVMPVRPLEGQTVQGGVIPSPYMPLVGSVAPAPDKFALIIGNSETKIGNEGLPFAGDDAQSMRQALITNAGYVDGNVEVVVNATAAQIASSINALASRVTEKSTVFVYFTGIGESIGGKDYLTGVDTDMSSDTSSMIAKDDLYKAFMAKGARTFAFFQTNRPIVNGHYFGSQIPLVGSISQMQATIPGGSVYSIVSGGKPVGLFTNAIEQVLAEVRSNRTPILEFGWQVFYKLRRGDTGQFGGGSSQSPSLPVLTNMASDARF